MFQKLKKLKLSQMLFGIFVLIILQYFNFFLSIYDLLSKNYQERMKYVYGNCEKESFGYLSLIEEKFKLQKNITILNTKSFPSSNWFFYKNKKGFDNNYLIILNSFKNPLLINKEDKNNILFKDYDLSKFKILHKLNTCYFLEKI